MDDLAELRALGRTLEHEPPSLVRQRNRLTAAKPRALRRWMIASVAATLTAVAIVMPMEAGKYLDDKFTGPSTLPLVVKLTKAVNVLILGSDRRGSGGERSDTIIVAHIPADGRDVKVVSIPRDSVVQIPACMTSSGKAVAAHRGLINEAFAIGGMACTWKTVEALTRVHLDHGVVVDFAGVKNLVNALGGVEVVVPHDMNDEKSGLNLRKGRQLIHGETALAYVRTRAMGDGSDISRIKRQQQFLAALVKRATPLLNDPIQLMRVLEAATKTISMDKDLTMERMMTVLQVFRENDDRKITYFTVPWKAAPGGRVAWKQPEADALWARLR